MNRHVSEVIVTARALRRAMGPAEQQLWEMLRGKRLSGFKFRRKVPHGRFFADFVCHARGVAILVEEGFSPSRDPDQRARDEYLMHEGFAVFRVPAVNVLADPPGVRAAILAVLEERLEEFCAQGGGSPLPSLQGRGRDGAFQRGFNRFNLDTRKLPDTAIQKATS